MKRLLEFLYQMLYRAPLKMLYRSFLFRPVREWNSRLQDFTRREISALRQQLEAIQKEAAALNQLEIPALRQQLVTLAEEVKALNQKMTVMNARRKMRADGTGKFARGTEEDLDGYVAICGRNMQGYFSQVSENYLPLANSFQYYRDLVDSLLRLERLRIVQLCNLFSTPADGQRLLGLRHDIDADPVTALRAARHLARYGVPGSFYLLHTANYYGNFYHGVFVRNPLIEEWVRGLIVAGCEIGVHNDALGAYCFSGVDGPEALKTEIEWLRSQGAIIKGTVGHNSAPIYGAENSEVLQGRKLWPRNSRSHEGYPLPLEVLSESELGLSYEGTFAQPKARPDTEKAAAFCANRDVASVRSETWMRQYLLDNPCCNWAVDFQFWLVGKDQWVAGGRFGEKTIFEWQIGLDRLFHLLQTLPEGSRSIMVIHPEYVRG